MPGFLVAPVSNMLGPWTSTQNLAGVGPPTQTWSWTVSYFWISPWPPWPYSSSSMALGHQQSPRWTFWFWWYIFWWLFIAVNDFMETHPWNMPLGLSVKDSSNSCRYFGKHKNFDWSLKLCSYSQPQNSPDSKILCSINIEVKLGSGDQSYLYIWIWFFFLS